MILLRGSELHWSAIHHRFATGAFESVRPESLGLFHLGEGERRTPQFSFYYTLFRSKADDMPPNGFLAPLLDVRLPDGLE